MPHTYKIRQILPETTGNWFVITNPEADHRWFMERVAVWALVEADGLVDHVRGVGGDGMPLDAAIHPKFDGESFIVHGPDMSPTGKTWAEVYAAGEILGMSSAREITDVVRQKAPEAVEKPPAKARGKKAR